MGTINETVRTANSALRTVLLSVIVFGAGLAGWKGYTLYNRPLAMLAEKERELDAVRRSLVASEEQVDTLSTEIEQKNKQLERFETSIRLLKLSHRIARLRVLDQTTDPESGRLISNIEFFEVNADGAPLGDQPKQFQIEGNRVYVECLVVKFEDRYIEQADLDRATAICLFQRIFGEFQQPQDGFTLDQVGSSPTSYARGGKVSEFEQQIWNDFWTLASDRKKAAKIGIRAAHADAPSTQVRAGVTYELELRSTGEFTLRPLAVPSDAS